MKNTLRAYYHLTKPGIVYGNLFSMLAGLAFAARGNFQLALILEAGVGLGFVIASACVFNNALDRKIDEKMTRTKDRALVTGAISLSAALLFATILGTVGFVILATKINFLSAGIAAVGFSVYLALYGYAKRASHWGTIVGSISGAVPIVVGYTAVTGHLDVAAGLLFFSMAIWQMPHFYAIAIYRGEEYAAAGIPVLPVQKGIPKTKQHIVGYLFAYLLVISLPTFLGYTGIIYLFVALFFGVRWVLLAFEGFKTINDVQWARKLFKESLIMLMVFSVAIACGPLLP